MSKTTIVCALGVLLVSRPSFAADARLHSMPAGPDGFLTLESATVGPPGTYRAALGLELAERPGTAPDGRRIDRFTAFDLAGSYGVARWLELGLVLGLSDVSGGAGVDGGFGIDDLRLQGRTTIARRRGFSLGLVPFVETPTGDRDRAVANGSWDGGMDAIAELRDRGARLAIAAGIRANGEGDDEIHLGLALGFLVWNGTATAVEMLGEIAGASGTEESFASATTAFEALGGAHLYHRSGLVATLGLGAAVTDGFPGADLRAILRVGYGPPPPSLATPPAPPPPPPPPLAGVVVTDEEIVTLAPILFGEGAVALPEDAGSTLDRVVAALERHPEARVRIEGHTDAVGGEDSNLALSEERAAAVRGSLVERGVPPERMTTSGHGERRPVASNETADGRRLNRRTEIHLEP